MSSEITNLLSTLSAQMEEQRNAAPRSNVETVKPEENALANNNAANIPSTGDANADTLIKALSADQTIKRLLQKQGLKSLNDPTLIQRAAERDLTNEEVPNESLTGLLENAEFQALKASNPERSPEELATIAPKKMNALALLMQGPEAITLPDGKAANTQSVVKKIKELSEEYKKSQIPFVDGVMSAIRENSVAKIASIVFIPTLPLAFLAMADAKTPARRVQADLALAQRTLVNSMVKNGQMKNILQQTIEHLDLLNDLDVKTVLNTSKDTKSQTIAAPMMKLLLDYLLTDREKLELSAGELGESTLNAKLNDPKNNRIEMAKKKLNKLVEYLDLDVNKVLGDIENSLEKSSPLKVFAGNYFGFDQLFLDKNYEGAEGRQIDPFLTETLKMPKDQVIRLSENLEQTLAGLGIIFDKTATEIGKAYEHRSRNQRIEDLKFGMAATNSVGDMINSRELKASANAAQDITSAVAEKLPNALDALGKELGGSLFE